MQKKIVKTYLDGTVKRSFEYTDDSLNPFELDLETLRGEKVECLQLFLWVDGKKWVEALCLDLQEYPNWPTCYAKEGGVPA